MWNWLKKNPFNSLVADPHKWVDRGGVIPFLISSDYCETGPKSYFLLFLLYISKIGHCFDFWSVCDREKAFVD